jgi:NodT family efflux transporter outer membrane factor (OMF) lipoprotein
MRNISLIIIGGILLTASSSCKVPAIVKAGGVSTPPAQFVNQTDSVNSADIKWNLFFTDKKLQALIDTAIKNNQDVLIAWKDIEIAQNEIRARKGLLSPFVVAGGSTGIEKVGRYTSQGAGDASADITPGKVVPENLTDFYGGFKASWEADIWKKLQTSKKAAFEKYLSSIEGKNFVLTNLIAEVANRYYELLALDAQLKIISESIKIQQNELEIVKIQKQAAVVTELAVKQFEAQLYNAQSMQFEIQQGIVENENQINFLLGRFPQKIERETTNINQIATSVVKTGLPSQLLSNRPDIRQAEYELEAAKLDVKVARAEFYPSLGISAGLGLNSFKTKYIFTTPQSLIYSIAGDLTGPLLNKSLLKSEFNKASAYQKQALFEYQKRILNGFAEASNELSRVSNLDQQYQLKEKEVAALSASVGISAELFKSARANYLEVLMAQRDALSAQLELIDVKKSELNASVNLYKAIGGGWK